MLERLNEAVNEVFLGGRFESRPLYLVLDNQGRSQLAAILEKDPDEVEAYCCSEVGAKLEKAGDPFSRFEATLWRWTLSGQKSRPPFTALLFVLSHAAEQMVSDGGFTAGNYYDRLSALVNVPAARLSQHGRSTEQFWKAFNGWLANNDFAYGRPTARPVNANKYVGKAMSQAIVREADRQRLHLMFEKYGFANTDDVSESEIEQYISTWIRSTQPTRQLKEAWKKTELRPRICEAVLAELEDWQAETSPSGGGEGGETSRLSLAAQIRHGLFDRSVALYFGRHQSSDPAELEFEDEHRLELSNSTFAGFATLEPRSFIPLARSLLQGIEVKEPGGRTLRWKGRAAIPLSRSDQGYWTEVSRVSLGVEHMVLVRDDRRIRGAIESALIESAAPGYTVASAANLNGVPPGWVIYEKVVIKHGLRELRGFEAVLSPVGETTSLSFNGGVRLGRGIWHLMRPPTVNFDGARPGVSITAWEGTSADGDPLISISTEGRSLSLDLGECLPTSKNLYLEGAVAKNTVASATLLFRSADHPRPRDRQAHSVVAYTGILSTTTGRDVEVPVVRGLVAPAVSPVDFSQANLSAFQRLDDCAPGEENDNELPAYTRSLEPVEVIKGLPTSEVLALPCAVRGLHRLKYATIAPGAPRYAPVDVECLDCDITYIHRHKPNPAPASRPRQAVAVPQSARGGSETARRDIDFDLWLDGACFLGSGGATVFETFAASSGIDTWRAGGVLRDLAWLGHVDVETGPTHRARGWSVGRPTWTFTAPGRAVLSGFRCNSLVEEIGAAVLEMGGRFETKRRQDHPAILVAEGLEEQDLVEAMSGLRDPHEREIAVVANAPLGMLSFLHGRSSLVNLFKPVSLGSTLPLQRFDVGKSCWRNADGVSGVGAYRVSGAGTSYAFVTPSGRALAGPHELVKLAAARAAGLTIHAYDPATLTFTCRTGCEPVGLLGRALVACVGELPEITDGTTTFQDVSPEVAAGVLHYLYDGELPA